MDTAATLIVYIRSEVLDMTRHNMLPFFKYLCITDPLLLRFTIHSGACFYIVSRALRREGLEQKRKKGDL